MASKKKKLVPPPEIAEPQRLKKSDQRLDAIINTKQIAKQYDRAVKTVDAWVLKTFKGQGALGPIPGWFTKNEAARLSDIRGRLVKWPFTLSEIQEMMGEHRGHFKDHAPCFCFILRETYTLISAMCVYDDAISAGPDEGLKMMVGTETAKDLLAHEKVKKGSNKGVETRFGTKEERAESNQDYQTAINKLHANNQQLSYTDLCRKAASEFEVSYKTLLRHTESPHKKK